MTLHITHGQLCGGRVCPAWGGCLWVCELAVWWGCRCACFTHKETPPPSQHTACSLSTLAEAVGMFKARLWVRSCGPKPRRMTGCASNDAVCTHLALRNGNHSQHITHGAGVNVKCVPHGRDGGGGGCLHHWRSGFAGRVTERCGWVIGRSVVGA
jgi:hypothetical protein